MVRLFTGLKKACLNDGRHYVDLEHVYHHAFAFEPVAPGFARLTPAGHESLCSCATTAYPWAVGTQTNQLRRRTLLLGTIGAVLAAGTREARADQARVLLLGGSSMVGSLGRLLEEGCQRSGFETLRDAKISSGLARPDFFDWPARAGELYRSFKPTATVCMFGGNDGQGLAVKVDGEAGWIRWHEPGWPDEYAKRVHALITAVSPAGEPVFWLGMPMMANPARTTKMQRINELAREQLQQSRAGYFVDTWHLLADRGGAYTRRVKHNGRWLTVRAKDGVHLTREGAQLVAEYVVPIVRSTISR